MLKISDLKELLKEHGIKFYSYWNKKKFLDVAREYNLIPMEEVKEPVKERNYERLKNISKNPRKVILKDVETEEETTFPSIYKAGKFIDRCPQTIENWNGRVWNGK